MNILLVQLLLCISYNSFNVNKFNSNFIEPCMIGVKGGVVEIIDEENFGGKVIKLDNYYISKYEISNREFIYFLNDISSEITIINNDNVIYQNKIICNLLCFLGDGITRCPDIVEFIQYDSTRREGDRFIVLDNYENYPVGLITYYGAEYYCDWLSRKTNKNYQLPTEAEWIFAAKGGTLSNNYLFAGSNNADTVSWCNKDVQITHYPKKVGKKKSNELGIYDMSGNVEEWCRYNNGISEELTTNLRILKGGNIFQNCNETMINSKRLINGSFSAVVIGFRITLYK